METDRRLYLAAVALFALALAALIGLAPVLPMQDTPDHLAMVDLWRRTLAGEPGYADTFTASPLRLAYVWFYGYALAVAPFVSLDTAVRVYIIGYAWLWLVGLHLILGERPASRWFVLLAAPLVFNGIFFLGFLNLLYVYPLAAIGLGVIVRDPRPSVRVPLLVALSLLILLAHAIGYVLWVAFACGAIAFLRGGSVKERALAALPVAGTAVFLPFLVGSSKAGRAAAVPEWKPLAHNLDHVWQHVSPLAGLPGLALPLAFGACAILLMKAMREQRASGGPSHATSVHVGLAVGSAVATFALPFAYGPLSYINIRAVPFAYLGALGAVGTAGVKTPRLRALVAALGLLLLLADASAFASYAREAGPLLAMGQRGEKPLRVLPLIVTRTPSCLRGIHANLRLGGVLTLRNGWVNPWVCSLGAGEMPLAFRSPLPEGDEYGPENATAELIAAYDLVCVYAAPGHERASVDLASLEKLLAAHDLVESSGSFRLYRVRHGNR